MIAYDLECSKGHIFEGWFSNSDSFEKQYEKGLVSCPFCNDTQVKKILSPVATRTSSRCRDNEEGIQAAIDYHRLAKEIVNYVHTNFEDVGANFAREALKIHYGVSEKRNIRGSATADEESVLKDEGIRFFKLPVPGDKDDEKKGN